MSYKPGPTPLVSVITVSLNSEKSIHRTIESVVNQTYKNIEFIVIDGGSKDKTLNIIRRYNNLVKTLITEPDDGIYDAMNKGIRIANGEWIHLLNSDDYYASPTAIESAIRVLDPNYTNYFGMIRETTYHHRVLQSWKYKRWQLFISAFLPHPALIISKAQYESTGFYDTQYKIAADHDMTLRLTDRWPGKLHDFPLTVMQQGGVSEMNKLLTLREFEKITQRHGLPTIISKTLYLLKRIWWGV
jgi:glycosyltransferase involved in cell wall biosynthesis